jgi:uncharacterized protein YcaQ
MATHLSLEQAKALAIHAQGLSNTPVTTNSKELARILPALGAVQLDTISTLARSHELVHYARSADVKRTQVETALWGNPPHTFEYWSHAACVLPMDMFPFFATRRRGFIAKKGTWNNLPSAKTIRTVKARLAESQATATELGGAKKGGDWWDWSETKEALEWLLAIGQVVCTQRIGWRRVYSLTENSVPAHLLNSDSWTTHNGITGPTDDECVMALLLDAIRSLGVGTENDLIDVHRLSGWHTNRAHVRKIISMAVENEDLIPVSVDGWSDPTYASPRALSLIKKKSITLESTTTLLSPFDSLVWHRERVARLFAMDYRLEAYTPASKRIYGYFAMPVLHNADLVARVDPGRVKDGKSTVMVAKTVTFETNSCGAVSAQAIIGTAQALVRAATWVNASRVELGDVQPASAQSKLAKALELQNC